MDEDITGIEDLERADEDDEQILAPEGLSFGDELIQELDDPGEEMLPPDPKPDRPKKKPADEQSPVLHDCGLPRMWVDDNRGRVAIAAYVNRHGVSHALRKDIQYTQFERDMFQKYQQARGRIKVGKDYFVAALRLFRAGYRIDPDEPLDLNNIKVTD